VRKSERPSVASITVTWNGTGAIPGHLEALKRQTVPLAELVVVDNASTDGTLQAVQSSFPDVTCLSLRENGGVGGGFATGLEYAIKRNHEWFWLFDQDSVTEPRALEKLLDALGTLAERPDHIGIVAPLLVDPECGIEHVGYLWRDRLVRVPEEQAQLPVLFVDTVMSSGSLIHRDVLDRAGLPRADFFMDWVDHEYNLRVRRQGFRIAQVRASIVYHRLGEVQHVTSFFKRKPAVRLAEPLWRRYFMTRNETFTCWHLFGTTRSRFLLLLRLLRHTASNAWHEERRLQNLRTVWTGFWDGYRRDLSRGTTRQ
jgi:rhamnopyranosyl-N-acetylglucosaminyl-diphospho-decaprenol beta-1,3/1,4-galactofuranosyltransferase